MFASLLLLLKKKLQPIRLSKCLLQQKFSSSSCLEIQHAETIDCDVIVVGAGAIGSSITYWLKQQAGSSLNVLVIDKDLTYKKASTVLSVGGIRQQFSLKENVQLSVFGAEFIQNINYYLSPTDKNVNVEFKPFGYLLLASEKCIHIMKENQKNQKYWGADNELLLPNELNRRFPWLNTNGIALGCLGLKNEGWFDPWSFLTSLVARAKQLGACFMEAEPIGFVNDTQTYDYESNLGCRTLRTILVKKCDGNINKINFSHCIIATGAETGAIMKKLLYFDRCDNLLKLEVPIERRKRFVYCFESPEGGLEINTPMIVDISGMYVRREGFSNTYICGYSPPPEEECSTENLDVDYNYFSEYLWPLLAERISNFEKLKLKSGWAGYYDYNSFDQNGIVGFHPAFTNVIIASGFSGHGLQHSPGIGRAVSELLLNGSYKTIDLTRFNFNRIMEGKRLTEDEII